MAKKVGKDIMEKIVTIKKLLTDPDILINASMICGSIYKKPDVLDLIAAECRDYIFKCVVTTSKIVIIHRILCSPTHPIVGI